MPRSTTRPRPPGRSARAPTIEGEARRPVATAGAEATCSVRFLHPFARYLAKGGHDCEAWLGPHGLTMAALEGRDLRLPRHQAKALIDRAIELTGEHAIGLYAARCQEPGDFNVVEYAAANCASVGEALQLAARFTALMHDGIALEIEVAPPLAALRVRGVRGGEFVGASVEFLFATFVAFGARSVGRTVRPLRVEFAHPGPPDRAVYEETFREVRFDCAENAMWLPASALDLPHRAPDRSLLQILTSHADGLLERLSPPPAGFAERTREAIAEALLSGHSAEQIARRLAVSQRTLHRRLAEEGTSHGELVDDVRRTRAMLHLGSGRFSIGEISFLLGFAHSNAFHKAFKRWTGMTPAQYRDEAIGAPSRR